MIQFDSVATSAPPAAPSRQLERTNDCSNAVGACKPCCGCWKTDTFRNAPLQRKLTLLQICTFPIGKLWFLHVATVAAQARGMLCWRCPSPTANSCYFPDWKTDISENLALMQPVPVCKHVTFSARRRELVAMTGGGAPMVKISLFLLGKQRF